MPRTTSVHPWLFLYTFSPFSPGKPCCPSSPYTVRDGDIISEKARWAKTSPQFQPGENQKTINGPVGKGVLPHDTSLKQGHINLPLLEMTPGPFCTRPSITVVLGTGERTCGLLGGNEYSINLWAKGELKPDKAGACGAWGGRPFEVC